MPKKNLKSFYLLIQPFFLKILPNILNTSFAAKKSEAILPGIGHSSTTSKPITFFLSMTFVNNSRV